MRRSIDIVAAFAGLLLFSPLFLLVAVLVKATSAGPVLHWSDRIGVNNTKFKMPKFRTLRCDAPLVASHLLVSRPEFLTPVGGILRRFSIDELPQLFSILNGDLTIVGPRPALFNQDDLTELRTRFGVHKLVPGLTGWAQVNERAVLTVAQKAALDRDYMLQRSLLFDLCIVVRTIPTVLRGRS
jgi:O-antigen biosynthesis protein WbqP